jgi:hypothetical protein
MMDGGKLPPAPMLRPLTIHQNVYRIIVDKIGEKRKDPPASARRREKRRITGFLPAEGQDTASEHAKQTTTPHHPHPSDWCPPTY